MSTRNPKLDDVIEGALEERLGELYVALPGVVQAYDSASQKASVAPSARVAHTDEDGRRVVEALPMVTGVPVVFPGGGGFTVTFPVLVGDTVLLIFSGASLDKWKAGAGGSGAVDPEYYSRHPIADAIAIPGLRNFRNVRASAPTDHVRIGTDAGSAQGVALGESLDSYINGSTPSPLTDTSCLRGFLAAVAVVVNGITPGTVPATGPTAPGALKSGTVKVTS